MKRLFYIVGLAMIALLAKAQIINDLKNIVSPNAASLGMYGEVPVSPYTGTANISIPIYEVKSKNVTVPISLDYFSGGVRPDNHPSWVGLGWTLKAGGMISRAVKGIPDDYREGLIHLDSHQHTQYKQGFYYSHSTPIENILSALNRNDGLSSDIYQDSEPDEFSFNFLGFSGKFYIDNAGKFSVQCNRPVKVEYTGPTRMRDAYDNTTGALTQVPVLCRAMPKFVNGVPVKVYGIFNEFTLTDEFGNKYIFGNRYTGYDIDGYQSNIEGNQGSAEAIEYSIDIFNQKIDDLAGVDMTGIQVANGGMWIASSWMLREIECANGETITFNYSRGPFISQLATSFYCTNASFYSEFNAPISEYMAPRVQRQGQLISPLYLSGISVGDLTVSFQKSESDELCYDEVLYKSIKHDDSGINRIENNDSYKLNMEFLRYVFPFDGFFTTTADLNNLKWQKLDEINIQTHNNLLKSVKLHYLPNEVYGKKQRLVLDKLGVKLGTSEVEQFHKFSYYALDLLPKYLSENVDDFGFLRENNGLYNEGDKSYYFTPAQYPTVRKPTNLLSYAMAGSLQSITYPTGGSTEFEYELNRYKKIALGSTGCEALQDEQIAGGIRIKTITTKDPSNNTPIIKSFDYRSSGVLSGTPVYNQISNYELLSELGVITQTFRGTTLFPISNNSGGSHITYTNVREYDGDNDQKGYTEYTYTNYDNGFVDPNVNFIFDVRNSMSQRRGLLKQEIKFDKDNKEVYNLLNDYLEFTNYTTPAISCFKYDVSSYNTTTFRDSIWVPGILMIVKSGDYLINPSVLLPIRKTTSYGSNKAKEIINYTYHSSYPLMSDEEHIGESGMFEIHKTYPFDLYNHTSIPSVNPTDTLIKRYWNMTQQHFLNFPVEITRRIKKGPDYHVVESRYNHYTEITTPIQLVTPGGPTTSMKNYLIAATYTLSTNKAIGQSSFHPLSIFNTTRDSHYSLVPEVSVRYNEYSNIQQINDKEGVTTIISRGYNPDYPDFVIKNATNEDVKSVLDNHATGVDENLWEKLNSTWNKPVSVHLYSFTPNIGLNYEITENGNRLSYTYDTSYRLKTITKNGKLIKSFNYHLK